MFKIVQQSTLSIFILAICITFNLFPNFARAQSIQAVGEAMNSRILELTSCPGDLTVGLFPPQADDLPITSDAADALYEAFIGALLETAPDCIRYIDGRGAFMTLEYLAQTGQFRASGQQQRAAIQLRLAEAEIVIDSRFIVDPEGQITLAFRATDTRDGAAIARASVPVPANLHGSSCAQAARPIYATLDDMAQRLAERSSDLSTLVVSGAYFASGDAQTSFGAFVQHELVTALSRFTEDVLTERSLVIYSLSDGITQGARLAGMRSDVAEAEAAASAFTTPAGLDPSEPGLFRLHMRYWLCEGDQAARISAVLTAADGTDISEVAVIQLDGVPEDLNLRPLSADANGHWGQVGPFAFQLSTQAGPNPVLRAGDRLELGFWLSQSGWVYCYYTESGGVTHQLLPHPAQSGTPPNYYEAHIAHVFPDAVQDRRLNFQIDASTVGEEVITCFATTRDVAADLPFDLRGVTGEPVPTAVAARLFAAFDGLENTRVAMRTETVTVLD